MQTFFETPNFSQIWRDSLKNVNISLNSFIYLRFFLDVNKLRNFFKKNLNIITTTSNRFPPQIVFK